MGFFTNMIKYSIPVAGPLLMINDAVDAVSDYHNEIRRSGYEAGFREAEVETKKKFLELLKENDNLKLGVFALSVHIARLDGLDDSEVEFIEKQIGRPDGTANMKIRERLQSIWESDMSFSEIDKKFLSAFSKEVIKELDGVIDAVIKSDKIISDREQEFLEYVWKPYLNRRLNL